MARCLRGISASQHGQAEVLAKIRAWISLGDFTIVYLARWRVSVGACVSRGFRIDSNPVVSALATAARVVSSQFLHVVFFSTRVTAKLRFRLPDTLARRDRGFCERRARWSGF